MQPRRAGLPTSPQQEERDHDRSDRWRSKRAVLPAPDAMRPRNPRHDPRRQSGMASRQERQSMSQNTVERRSMLRETGGGDSETLVSVEQLAPIPVVRAYMAPDATSEMCVA